MSPKTYERLRWVEKAPPGAFYHSIVAEYVSHKYPLRVGRVGDMANLEHANAVIDAILEYDIPFMWTTRAWRSPTSAAWKLLEERLPGQVFCSLDQETDRDLIPQGWPTADVAMPPLFEVSAGTCWCPHYPHPDLPIEPVYNCVECMLCYARPGESRKRPHVAFMLHAPSARRRLELTSRRKHYPKAHWLQHMKTLCQRRSKAPSSEGHESHFCGIYTPDGWVAPDDNA